MKTKSEQMSQNNPQAGNALIYVLIAIVLFAGLSFTLARQNRNQTTEQVANARGENYTVQLISYTAQVQSVIDQMSFTGTQPADFDFTLPSEAGFNTPPDQHKVYHPAGGGLSPYNLPQEIADKTIMPTAGFYLGLFNNVEWTPTAADDVVLAAYGISRDVCQSLNEKITGTRDIPAVNGNLERYFVDAEYHSSNQNFESADCALCEDKLSLCVSDSTASKFVFYTVVLPR